MRTPSPRQAEKLRGFSGDKSLCEDHGVHSSPVETSDWFMTDRSAGVGGGLTYAAIVVHAAICVKLFRALNPVCIV